MTAFGNAAAAIDDDGRLLQLSYVTVLDGGTFGTVYRALLTAGGGTARMVAVKRIRSPGGGRHELDAHRRLRHPNVVRLLFHFYSGNEQNIIDTVVMCARHYITHRVGAQARIG